MIKIIVDALIFEVKTWKHIKKVGCCEKIKSKNCFLDPLSHFLTHRPPLVSTSLKNLGIEVLNWHSCDRKIGLMAIAGTFFISDLLKGEHFTKFYALVSLYLRCLQSFITIWNLTKYPMKILVHRNMEYSSERIWTRCV